MKKLIILGFLLIGTILSGCSNNNLSSNNTNIKMEKTQENKPYFEVFSAEKVKEIITDEDYIILDIRDENELKDLGTITDRKDLLNINFYGADFRENLDKLDKNQKYIIYCNSGNRTRDTFEIMKELGFKHVIDLEGGIQNWIGKKYKTYFSFK